MPDYVPGQRYPMSHSEAASVLRHGWPAVHGEPDLARGRRFLSAPCEWEFWLTDGRKVHFSFDRALIVSASKGPDPDRPDPL